MACAAALQRAMCTPQPPSALRKGKAAVGGHSVGLRRGARLAPGINHGAAARASFRCGKGQEMQGDMETDVEKDREKLQSQKKSERERKRR